MEEEAMGLEAYDSLDPNGNITIKWDIMSWIPDGYVAVVSIFNFQRYRQIQEVIWSILGAQTTEQGDCSRFKGNIPHCCKKAPETVDLLPGTRYNQQVANCCKGGVISSWVQDPANAVSSFLISVGSSGTSNKSVRVPRNSTLRAPGPGYTCGPARIVQPSKFKTMDRRRETQALSKFLAAACTYSQFLSRKTPPCCVSLSAFYNKTVVPCPTCSFFLYLLVYRGDSPQSASASGHPGKNSFTPLVECTSHMCPVCIHWHVKTNSKEYLRVKITITNLNYRMNYTQWNLVSQYPHFDNLTKVFSFNYKRLPTYGSISFTLDKGWAFPRQIYFNGDNCVMPPPDAYPWLSNSTS
ncbi:hypothetical protein MKW98_004034 [Papaver atlanticum]|uniref:COBRA C-terminal domain-containing protein n=1 Tax=Papaver atlanticum TaxID=357466 RepID=A0AAD4SYY4_9MAGN|nr:hypothetical protein MKW98_004034 [Papaver atlanticum]